MQLRPLKMALPNLPFESSNHRMTLKLSRISVLLLALPAIAPTRAAAQPVFTSEKCVELLAAESPLVVRGVIEEIEPHDPDSTYGLKTITFRVRETLRGPHEEQLRFVHDGGFSGYRTAQLREDKQEMLLMLADWRRVSGGSRRESDYGYARFPWVVRRAFLLRPEWPVFTHTSVPPYSARRRPITTSEELIDTIRGYLAMHRHEMPEALGSVELPPEHRGGAAGATLYYPLEDPPEPEPLLDFAAFKRRFAVEPPREARPPYLRSQSGYVGVYALEWMAADCDEIVRGVIEDSCFVAESDDSVTGPRCAARIRVLETFKGKAPEFINAYIYDSRDLETLCRERRELVLFLRNRGLKGPSAALGRETRDGLWDDSVIVLDSAEAEVLLAEMKWTNEPAAILARLRALAQAEGMAAAASEPPPIFSVHPPISLAAGSSLEGNQYAVVYLPVDAALEANARRWAKSENPDLRWLAARALLYFKSEENAELLKGLLPDDSPWPRSEMRRLLDNSPLPGKGPEFLVRWEAWQVLNGWGYKIPRPEFKAAP